MKVTETIKEAALKVGMAMAKVDTNTTCLWINYQAQEPDVVIKMRKKRCYKFDKKTEVSNENNRRNEL